MSQTKVKYFFKSLKKKKNASQNSNGGGDGEALED